MTPQPPSTQTGIQIKLGFFPLAFFLFACKPRVEIDGHLSSRYWGTHFFPVVPGPHTICVYFRYLVMPRCGESAITVNVNHGQVVKVSYFMPPWMLAKGSLKIV